jgi:cobalt-zinc-cadmium efflux system membrane fusion protein
MFNHDPSRSEGKLIWIDTSVNENDRMVKARAVIENTNGNLKAGMFGKANIVMSAPKNALRIPYDAVHQLENQDYVFVKVEDDLFDLRRIDIGGKNGEYVDVIDGIHSDERIVVAGKFTMVSEYLKSRLGAGCVDD